MNRIVCGKKAGLLIFIAVFACSAACTRREHAENSSNNHMKHVTHPGTILYVNQGDGSIKRRPAEEVSENSRFVYLIKGVETRSKEEADEIIPIVEVNLVPYDSEGKVVKPALAKTILVREFGPNHRELRSTKMIKDK